MKTDIRSSTPDLRELIESIGSIVRTGDDPARRAAGVLAHYLKRRELLTPAQRVADPTRYKQHVLHVEEDGSFSIVSLVWLPGQVTPIHDHVSWCVVGVHRGQEDETLYRVEDRDGSPCLVEKGRSTNGVGSVEFLMPPGDIHMVANSGRDVAISIHIYGADIRELGSSIRRRYDLPVAAGGPRPADSIQLLP